MESKIEPRKNFYSKELNYDRMESVLEYVVKNLTLQEVLKMIREISWDMVYYNDKNDCGIIYKKDNYTEQNQWEACQIQSLLRTACDLFSQSILDEREFGDYLNHWINGGALENEVAHLKKKIDELEEELEEERNKND